LVLTMLNTIIFEVLDEVLDGNVFSVNCHFSKSHGGHKLDLMTRRAISYKNFIEETKSLVLEYDVTRYDEDSDFFQISIDLTEESINKFIERAKQFCLYELGQMKK